MEMGQSGPDPGLARIRIGSGLLGRPRETFCFTTAARWAEWRRHCGRCDAMDGLVIEPRCRPIRNFRDMLATGKKKDDRELSRLHHRVGTRTKYFWSPRSGKTRSNSIKGSPAKQSRRARENSRKTRNPRRNFVEDYTDVLTDKNKTHSMSGLRCRRRQLERKQN